MKIRELQIEDAEQFLNLINTTDAETQFLLFEKGERKTTDEEEKEIIRKGKENGTLTFVAEEKEKLISQDDQKKQTLEIQKLTDNFIKMIDKITINKKEEILKV